jgi:hypothetical protein
METQHNSSVTEAEVKKDFGTTMDNFIHEFSAVKDNDVNKIPFDGSWTAGELGQHILLSVAGFDKVLSGPVKLTERPADKLIPQIKNILSDFSTKLKSPDFIDPEEKEYDKDELATTLKNVRSSIDHVIDKLDLTQTCTGMELPQLGFLTRLEAIYFVVYHTQRHTQQLKNIRSALAKN